jgi:hypothetical protein
MSTRDGKPTDVTLPKKVGLARSCVSAREFPVNLVLDATHSDESRDYTIPTTCLH